MPGLVAKLGLIRLQSSELFLNFGYLMIEFQIFNYLDELNANQIGTCWWTKCVFARSHTHTLTTNQRKKNHDLWMRMRWYPRIVCFFLVCCRLNMEITSFIIHKINKIALSIPTRYIWNEIFSKNSIYIFL